jgi:hypothetical protein
MPRDNNVLTGSCHFRILTDSATVMGVTSSWEACPVPGQSTGARGAHSGKLVARRPVDRRDAARQTFFDDDREILTTTGKLPAAVHAMVNDGPIEPVPPGEATAKKLT